MFAVVLERAGLVAVQFLVSASEAGFLMSCHHPARAVVLVSAHRLVQGSGCGGATTATATYQEIPGPVDWWVGVLKMVPSQQRVARGQPRTGHPGNTVKTSVGTEGRGGEHGDGRITTAPDWRRTIPQDDRYLVGWNDTSP
jgi:hypothetical protein